MFGFFKKHKEKKEQKQEENKEVKKETAKNNKNSEKTTKKSSEKSQTAKKVSTETKTETKSVSKKSSTNKPASKVKTTKSTAKKETEKVENTSQKNASIKGKFVYYKTAKGNFNYRLKANNNETIAVSGGIGYTSLSGCKSGIESVRKNVNAPIEDQTLKNAVSLPNPKFVIFKDKAGKFRYRLYARNGEVICTPEDGYASKDGCKKGIESLSKWATNSDIVSE